MKIAPFALLLAALMLVASATASSAASPKADRVTVARKYFTLGADYTLKRFQADQRASRDYAAKLAAKGQIGDDDKDRVARQHAFELRAARYPADWSQRQRQKLYQAELRAIERLLEVPATMDVPSQSQFATANAYIRARVLGQNGQQPISETPTSPNAAPPRLSRWDQLRAESEEALRETAPTGQTSNAP